MYLQVRIVLPGSINENEYLAETNGKNNLWNIDKKKKQRQHTKQSWSFKDKSLKWTTVFSTDKEKFSSASTSFWHIVNDSFLVSGILGTCLVLGLNGLWSSSGNVLKSYCHKSTEIQNNNLKAKDRGLESASIAQLCINSCLAWISKATEISFLWDLGSMPFKHRRSQNRAISSQAYSSHQGNETLVQLVLKISA